MTKSIIEAKRKLKPNEMLRLCMLIQKIWK